MLYETNLMSRRTVAVARSCATDSTHLMVGQFWSADRILCPVLHSSGADAVINVTITSWVSSRIKRAHVHPSPPPSRCATIQEADASECRKD